jgi:hypothetical protein
VDLTGKDIMSVNIEASTLSMPESLDSLKTTPLAMHRIWFQISDTATWYKIIQEANQQYSRGWRCQSGVRRKLERNQWRPVPVAVWFDVPDPNFASWIAIKHAVVATTSATK